MSTRKKIISVFFVVCGAAVAEFLTNVFLGRALTPDIFGRFKFIHTIVMTLGTLLVFGQDATLIRVLAGGNFKKYNWKKFIVQCFGISAVISAIALVFIQLYYHITINIVYILLPILSSISVRLFSSILRGYGKYPIAMFISRGFSFVFFLICLVLFALKLLHTIPLPQLIIWYMLAYILIFCIAIVLIYNIENGSENITFAQIKNGLWLFLITVSFTALLNINTFFLAKMMEYKDVAIYSIGITVTRGFDLICSTLWFVLMPTYSKDKNRPILPDVLKSLGLGIMVAVFYAIFGKFLIIFLFKGKYDAVIPLLWLFVLIGIFKVLYSIPSGVISGRFTTFYLKLFFVLSLISLAINIVGNYLFIPLLGIKGAVLSGVFAWFFRVSSAYYLIYINKKN